MPIFSEKYSKEGICRELRLFYYSSMFYSCSEKIACSITLILDLFIYFCHLYSSFGVSVHVNAFLYNVKLFSQNKPLKDFCCCLSSFLMGNNHCNLVTWIMSIYKSISNEADISIMSYLVKWGSQKEKLMSAWIACKIKGCLCKRLFICFF